MFPDWQWNEFRQVGTDYASEEEVARYDARMRAMRDVDAENRAILSLLQLPAADHAAVLEIGTGTGAFLRSAAPFCRRAAGIDVSPVMLRYAAAKAAAEGLTNIEFHHAGFLTFDFPDETFDGAVSGLALHHLPDLWKAVALRRIRNVLRPGGRFVLLDVIFDSDPADPAAGFSRTVDEAEGSRQNMARHIAQEFSTENWIMEGLLERAGLEVESNAEENGFIRVICARRR